MGKKELQTRLVTELTNIGVPTEISTTADIVINQNFTAEHNQGSIQFQGKLLFDAPTETIYYWEHIVNENEEDSLLSADGIIKSPAAHYKVKTIGRDRSGQQKEMTLDLSTIPLFIKSFAKSQHWGYKLVQDESKASYQKIHTDVFTPSPIQASNSGCLAIVIPMLIAIGIVILIAFI